MNRMGDPNPKLIEQALAALQPKYGEPWTERPTSVELWEDKGLARIWFEYTVDDMEEAGHLGFAWEFSLCIPLYHFWGKKKREKYFKEQKRQCEERARILDEHLKGIR